MKNYARSVLSEATETLCDNTCDALRAQWAETEKFLKDHVKQQEQEAERQKKLFEQWERDMESDSFNSEKAQLAPSVKLYAIEEIQRMIGA